MDRLYWDSGLVITCTENDQAERLNQEHIQGGKGLLNDVQAM